MTPDQLKAARGLLGWSLIQLGSRSGTSRYMVKTFEQTGRVVPLYGYGRTAQFDAIAAVRAALEAAGVEFTDGAVPGVQLRKPDQ